MKEITIEEIEQGNLKTTITQCGRAVVIEASEQAFFILESKGYK